MERNIETIVAILAQEQELGIKPNEIPIIIKTTELDYVYCIILYEDDQYLGIVEVQGNGEEQVKILNKEFLISVEILYESMLRPESLESIKSDKEVI